MELAVGAAVLLGLIPASIARSKGQNFALWWIFGVLMFIIALPAALLTKPVPGRDERYCPDCLSIVPVQASVCAHCRYEFTEGDEVEVYTPTSHKIVTAVFVGLGGLVALGLLVALVTQ